MLKVQEFLRNGGTTQELADKYCVYSSTHSKHPNLTLFKYDQINSPFAEEIVRECRGLILDAADNWKIVNFSMSKFFNHGEGHAATIDWAKAKCYEKVDGSLIQLYPYKGEWLVATSGSPDASGNVGDFGFTFVELFWKTFNHNLPSTDCGKCFWFELTSQFNKIVVKHTEPNITLLGGRDLNSLRELPLDEAHSFFPGVKKVKEFPLHSFDAIISTFEHISPLEQEGYVVFDGENRVKCKSPAYVALHHLKGSLGSSRRSLVEIVRSGEISEVLASFPEYETELLDVKSKLDGLISELQDNYNNIQHIESQKEFALSACKTRCSPALFSLRAKKTPSIRTFLTKMHIDSLVDLLDG